MAKRQVFKNTNTGESFVIENGRLKKISGPSKTDSVIAGGDITPEGVAEQNGVQIDRNSFGAQTPQDMANRASLSDKSAPQSKITSFVDALNQTVNLAKSKRRKMFADAIGTQAKLGSMPASDFGSVLEDLESKSQSFQDPLVEAGVEQFTEQTDRGDIRSLAERVAEKGGGSTDISAVLNAGSYEEALTAASPFLKEDTDTTTQTEEEEDETIFVDNETGKEYDFTKSSDIRQYKKDNPDVTWGDIRAHMDQNMTQMTKTTIDALIEEAGGGETEQNRFITRDYIRDAFTRSELEDAANNAGYDDVFGPGVGESAINKYIDDVMKWIERQRRAGKSDQEIYEDWISR